ncbi:hypothetical protein DB30_06722 [Enhygromyxa salina]|uniref:Uncharacterized protein n=1 Tax=Enhygromyxa salina TaxID=215803 RepID=A0A0C2CXX0_9BACT|nr:hypothetical protein DB30_06722 [Enhygromyxa salina]
MDHLPRDHCALGPSCLLAPIAAIPVEASAPLAPAPDPSLVSAAAMR